MQMNEKKTMRTALRRMLRLCVVAAMGYGLCSGTSWAANGKSDFPDITEFQSLGSASAFTERDLGESPSMVRLRLTENGLRVYVDNRFMGVYNGHAMDLALPPGKHVIYAVKLLDNGETLTARDEVELAGMVTQRSTPEVKKYTCEAYYFRKIGPVDVAGCEEYLKRYPGGNHVREVKTRLDRILSDEGLNTVADCNSWLAQYGDRPQAVKVKARLETLAAAELARLEKTVGTDGKLPNTEAVAYGALKTAEPNCSAPLRSRLAALHPDMMVVNVGSGVMLELKFCPFGNFTMGSPANEKDHFDNEVQHSTTLTKPFYIGKFEVTQRQWQTVMGRNPSKFTNPGLDAPVEQVSWDDYQEFIKALNARVPGGGFRLPTEAEWEYACRAGSSNAFAGTGKLDEMGWYEGNDNKTTYPVGQKKPNDWGLYDMHGNVWEWCQDWYGDYASDAVTNPGGATSGLLRVYRGGSWSASAGNCRSANRRGSPGDCSRERGLRLVRVTPAS
jgi:formylglycine-generating enzyme required for sulfatase activity